MEMMASERRDRAQLILIGAIAIAFIVLGIVVVFNSVLYSQTISSGNSIESATHADDTELELDRGVRGLVRRANVDSEESGPDGHLDDVNDSVEEYVEAHQNSTGSSRSAIVSVDELRIVDEATVARDRSNNSNQTIDFDDRDVGEVTVTIDPDGMNDTVSVDNGDGQTVEFAEAGGNISVDDGTESCTIDSPDGPVRFDLVAADANATIVEESCPLDLFDRGSDSSGDVEVTTTGSDVEYGYTVVLNESDTIEVDNGPNGDYAAAWTIAATYSYESNDVSYERELEIEIYGDDS